MSAITAKASRKMKKYAVLTREPRCFLGSFDFSWEQRKLTEFVEFFSGLTYTPNDVQENGTLVLRSSNVSNGEVVDADNIYVNPQVVNSENVKVGDIVVVVRNGSRSLIGKHAQIKAFMPNTVIGAFMTGIRSECPEFTNALLNTSRFEEEIAMNMGATINQITGYMFSKMEFKVPCLDEQKKIGEYFEKLDNLITLHQRKCVFLFGFFQAFISMIFTASTFSWEQRKLGDVVQITMGQSPDGSTYSDEPSDYILVQGNADLQNGWVCPRIWTTQITKKADAGDLIMSVRAPAGAMGKTAYNAVIGRGVAAIKGNEFIYQLLVKMDADGFWKTLSCGSTFESLNSDNIKNAEVKIPTTAEQIKIGGYFQQLDNLITLHQRECISFTARAGRLILTANKKRNTSSWEQRKAIDIADYSKGNGYSKGDLTDAGTPIILYGRLYTKYQFAISEVDTFAVPRNGAVYSQGNEVIVPASGETAEDIARASAVEKSGVLLGGDLNILRPFDFINPLFLALAISNGEPQKELAKKAQGKSVVHIHNTDIQEVTIAYPSRTEQDRIVSVFRQLDHLITLHQRKPFLMKWRTSDANRNQTNRLVL